MFSHGKSSFILPFSQGNQINSKFVKEFVWQHSDHLEQPYKKQLTFECKRLPTGISISSFYISCKRDVIIMIEDSSDQSGERYIKSFLTNVVSSIPLGPKNCPVAIATFNVNVHPRIQMDGGQNATSVLNKIQQLSFSHKTNSYDYNDVAIAIDQYADGHRNGDRTYVPDVIIVLTDHTNSEHSLSHNAQTSDHHINSNDVRLITINVGSRAAAADTFSTLASNSHTLNVDDYDQLNTLESKVGRLICH